MKYLGSEKYVLGNIFFKSGELRYLVKCWVLQEQGLITPSQIPRLDVAGEEFHPNRPQRFRN